MYHVSFIAFAEMAKQPNESNVANFRNNCVHYSCWKKIDSLTMLPCFKSSHFCCTLFLLLAHFQKEVIIDIVDVCPKLEYTGLWDKNGKKEMGGKNGGCQGGEGAERGSGAWDRFSACHHFFPNIIRKGRGNTPHVYHQGFGAGRMVRMRLLSVCPLCHHHPAQGEWGQAHSWGGQKVL